MPASHSCTQTQAPSCGHFLRLTDVLDLFFTHWLHVGNQLCARWGQKVHQKLQKYAKKEFPEKFGKIYDLTLLPHPMLMKLLLLLFFFFLVFWRYYYSYLSNKSLATFLPFLIPYLQPNVPVTQLWCPLCTCLLNQSLFDNPSLIFI